MGSVYLLTAPLDLHGESLPLIPGSEILLAVPQATPFGAGNRQTGPAGRGAAFISLSPVPA